MIHKLNAWLCELVLVAAVVVLGAGAAEAARPTTVSCGAGTHSVVRHHVVNGHRVRYVVCARNTVVHHHAVGTAGFRTTTNCGPGTHADVHHPVVNGRRVRRVVCVSDAR
jgi:hypothetical protein